MKTEVYFLRYAFPCAHVLCKVRKEISDEDYKKMEKAAANGEVLPRAYLEKVFFRAFKRIEKIADEMKEDKWDKEVIKEYFVNRHNDFVHNSENPETFKEMCKVQKAEILEIKDGKLLVRYDNKMREVKGDYIENAKAGDKVTIHYSYAVEKI